MNAATLAVRQVRFEMRTFSRNTTALVFTLLFPIMFLVVFGLGASGRTADSRGGTVPFLQFFLPGILAYGVIGACYTNLAMRLTFLRDSGVLKRMRGTPIPRTAYMAGHIGTSATIGFGISIITLLMGVVIYGVHVYAHTLIAAVATLVVGSATFCAIGLTVASIIPNADAAPAFVNFTILPIIFISDIFYSIADAPSWLKTVASVFPVKHFANALQIAFDPRTKGMGFSGSDLLVMAAWGLGAGVIAVKKFRWENATTK